MTSQELRHKFLKFFEGNNHKIIPSASLVPSEEEQLSGKEKVLFNSAGMQPLIPFLMGKPHPAGKRLADVQKCLRTDDIEEVGDSVHHTFFEMLGSWSLGDYWKVEAIRFSFKFLTKELEIPINKLAISVFAGDEDAPEDKESAKIWESLGIPKERIFYFGKEYNWWPTPRKDSVGNLKNTFGPCGPDTEMFYWASEEKPEGRPNENSNWVEIWNDVFMEFNRKDDGILEELSQKKVDTGMGMERTLAVLNGKKSAYETDLFEGFIKALEKETNKKYGENIQKDRSFRIIADHLRATSMLIIDNVRPDNKLQGYILRRLLRRAMFHGHLLGLNLTGSIFPLLIKEFQAVHPEITTYWPTISDVIDEEGFKFGDSLDRGLRKLEKRIKNHETINGLFIFDLYQSDGFPYELSKEILAQEKVFLNDEDFEQFNDAKRGHAELSRSLLDKK